MKNQTGVSINKKSSALPKIVIGGVAFFVIVFVFNLFGSQIKNSFQIASYPLESRFFTAGESVSSFFGSFLKAGALYKENENLKTENLNLLSQISLLVQKQEDGKDINEALANCKDLGFSLVPAGIIGLDEQDMVSINKGSADGVAQGMPVINQQNVLFGKVFKVYKNFSKVILISEKSSLIDVEVQNVDDTLSKIYGAVKGKGGLSVFLDLIPVDQEIKEGDVLITSALEGTFPKGLLVGKITKVEKNDQKPFQQAQIEPFFNLKNTDNLFIITNYKNEK